MLKKIGLIALLLACFPCNAELSERAWRFRVYLDDKEIGYHEYRLVEQDNQQRLETEARFEYKLLFITLYEYAHQNVEVWQDDCLAQIDSRTDANGNPYEVEGALAKGRFVLRAGDQAAELPGCIMSFAYWNPAFLQQDRLLNSQNGEFVEVAVGKPEHVDLEVRGAVQPALRYRLETKEIGIELYYSENQEWLALVADAAGGRKLRYELI
jgi:hypothetical protein